MECCLLYYKSHTQAQRASELLENYHIRTCLTKPPRDHQVNYCAYAVRIPQTAYGNAYDLLCVHGMHPIHCKSIDWRGKESL